MVKFYTVKQVAEALNFSTNTVYKYLDEGKIKATRLGKEGRFRIPQAEVLRLLQLKGENPQIASALEIGSSTNKDSIAALQNDNTDNLALLNKISNPDLFDWFLALSAIFLGAAFFLFPVHYQSLSFEPYRGMIFFTKLALGLSGIFLLGVDIFTPLKKHHHHILALLPTFLSFVILTYIFFKTGEYWSASYFATFALFSLFSFVWHTQSFVRFISFVYVLVVFSGFVFARDPTHLTFFDVVDFIKLYPGAFEILLVIGSTLILGLLLISYFKKLILLPVLSVLLSILFSLLAISSLIDQAWNRATVELLISAFAIIFLFERYFDSISKFSRKQVLIVFCWMVLVTFLGLVAVFYTQGSYRSYILLQSERKVDAAVKAVESYVADSLKYVTTLGQNKELAGMLSSSKRDQDGLDALSRQMFLGSTTLRRVVITDSNGQVISLYPPGDGILKDINLSDRNYFKSARENKKTTVSEVIPSKIVSSPATIVIASPVFDETGEFKGLVAGAIDTMQLEDKLSSLEAGKKGVFAIADSTKKIFIHPNKSLLGQEAKLDSALISAVNGQKGQIEGYSEDGHLSLQAFAPVKLVGWGVVAQEAFVDAFRELSRVSFAIFLVTIIAGVGTLMAVGFLSRRQL